MHAQIDSWTCYSNRDSPAERTVVAVASEPWINALRVIVMCAWQAANFVIDLKVFKTNRTVSEGVRLGCDVEERLELLVDKRLWDTSRHPAHPVFQCQQIFKRDGGVSVLESNVGWVGIQHESNPLNKTMKPFFYRVGLYVMPREAAIIRRVRSSH